uniref:Cytosol aminopeptidase domain-containing protein n=1 Tax=Physcomitrium patens TaxID=3218 RepID=A0A7I4EYY1_PHYPA
MGMQADEDDFTGKLGQLSVVRLASSKIKRLALVGLGRANNVMDAVYASDSWRILGFTAARIAKQLKMCSMGLAAMDTNLMDESSKLVAVESIASGAILGTYEDTRFKSEAKPSKLTQVAVMSLGTGSDRDEALRRAVCITAGVIVAKQLVAAPANVLTPGALADAAVSIAMAHSEVLTCTILEKVDCEALGMGAFLGVANGSDQPPKFIHLKYCPPDGVVYKRVAIVGKGICFDSGGYNIKTGANCAVELMKFDMGGAGAALGAASAIGALKPKGVEVHFISAACENMISGKGMRPGDIVTAMNGITIEVNNTDAEGRLTLADSLVYACRLRVDAIVDLATLTGACVVALGHEVGGFFTPSATMAQQLETAAQIAGEKIWRMPLVEQYKQTLESPIADLVNTSGRDGGSIKAALFLKEFVDPGMEWAHLDIAGPVWNRKTGTATGYPVRTLVKWIDQQQIVAGVADS